MLATMSWLAGAVIMPAWQLPRGMNILVANFGLVQIIRSVGLHVYGSSCGYVPNCTPYVVAAIRPAGCVALLSLNKHHRPN